jgi:DNA invertase Pin-like site-specific DNA recombinase
MSYPQREKLLNVLRAVRQDYHDRIASEIQGTTKTYSEIAEEYGISEQTVYQVARLRGMCRTARESEADNE